MDFITHWLKSREPEVVGLQKVKVSDADFPHATSGLSAITPSSTARRAGTAWRCSAARRPRRTRAGCPAARTTGRACSACGWPASTSRKFSRWDYRGVVFHRGMGLRIDLLLGAPAVAARVRRVEIDREYCKKKDGRTASDHAPVFADLD